MNVTNSSLSVNVNNANIPVSGNVNATITNATVPISGNVGISSGNVNAVIQGGEVSIDGGEVNIGGILTPVNVVGTGGEVDTWDAVFANGQNYFTYEVKEPLTGQRGNSWRITGLADCTHPLTVYVNITNSIPSKSLFVFTIPPSTTIPSTFDFIIPMSSNYPIYVTVFRGVSSGFDVCGFQIFEVSGGAWRPDNYVPYNYTETGTFDIGSGLELLIEVPASARPLRASVGPTNATAASVTGLTIDRVYLASWEIEAPDIGTQTIIRRNPNNNGGQTIPIMTNNVGSIEFDIPGDGLAHLVAVRYNNTTANRPWAFVAYEK